MCKDCGVNWFAVFGWTICFTFFGGNLAGSQANNLTITDDGKGLVFKADGNPIIRYNYSPYSEGRSETPDPAPVYLKRSGNIHPIWSPDGQILTEIFPQSHSHHLGIWGAWVKTRYKGESYDFWNLKKDDEEELIQFEAFEWIDKDGGSAVGFKANHIYLIESDGESQKVMRESLTVQVSVIQEKYLIDYKLEQEWLMEEPLTLLQHRYGGPIAWRYPSNWKDSSVLVVSPDGKEQRSDQKTGVDATNARWLKVHGSENDTMAGFLIMSHPDNFRHPEPLRVLHDGPGNGGYVHFSPIRQEAWKLEKGEKHTFRFRICTYDGILEPSKAEAIWQNYIN
ncbi:MAG: PmoA family protein [Verrucomicrobiota bacterium]